MSEDQKRQLKQQLWSIANILRGKMSADEYRDYILGFIFYKYLSERMHLYANELLEGRKVDYSEIKESSSDGKKLLSAAKEEALNKLGYFLKPSELFRAVAERGKGGLTDSGSKKGFILKDLGEILSNIERSTMGTESEDDFDKLFSELDLNASKLGKTPDARNTIIAQILVELDQIDFQLGNSEIDILGDAYEYLIGQFASGAGKKAGEFYTPQEVSEVLAQIVTTGKKKVQSVYDPTCGSGSLLLRVARHVKVGTYYGQESINTTYNLARMNMILHGVNYRDFDIKQEDTLEHPQHEEERFEAVVANPPFSAKWSANPIHLNEDRFSQYGVLAPKSKADYAFIQHMVHHLTDNGVMATIMPHGVLFRGGSEGSIREYLIREKNYLDAVIGLPQNIFFGTGIPACILVFKKCRTNPGDVIFIDASKDFERAKNRNYLRKEDIEKIIETYRERKTIKRYSSVIPLDKIAENDYTLNIPRYVDTFVEEKPVNLTSLVKKLKETDSELEASKLKIKKYCKQLNIEIPFK